ncbi:MAG: PqqD family protein [Clostridia bacterium]|nr:PqqD family protein [Clostridia bacterium]
MKLNSNLPVVEIDGESIMVFAPEDDNSFRGMLRSNHTANFIIECLKEETDEEAILEKLKSEFEGDEDEMREDIKTVIENLRTVGALEE